MIKQPHNKGRTLYETINSYYQLEDFLVFPPVLVAVTIVPKHVLLRPDTPALAVNLITGQSVCLFCRDYSNCNCIHEW